MTLQGVDLGSDEVMEGERVQLNFPDTSVAVVTGLTGVVIERDKAVNSTPNVVTDVETTFRISYFIPGCQILATPEASRVI